MPIGWPIANVDCYVLGPGLQRMPVGEVGELYIGGVQVALGYIDQPQLTAESFVELPYGTGLAYRTGDLVSWREDGALNYVGLRDDQVKVNGVRVELGEIEVVLSSLPDIADAAVTLSEDHELIAYVMVHSGSIDRAEIWSELRVRLPDQMLPTYLKVLDAMPLGVNGKLARADLPKPDLADRLVSQE